MVTAQLVVVVLGLLGGIINLATAILNHIKNRKPSSDATDKGQKRKD